MALIGNLAIGAAVVSSILVATGALVALLGGSSYRLGPEDDKALRSLGLVPSERGLVEGLWGSVHVTVDPGQTAVVLRARGLPPDWRIDRSDAPLAARTRGDVAVHRRTRDRLTELDALVQGAIRLQGGQLELELPRHAAEARKLPRLVELVQQVLEGLAVEPDWRAVALDGDEDTATRLLALQRLVRDPDGHDELARALREDDDPVMGLVSRSLSGDPAGLRAWCGDQAPSLALLAVPLLPPPPRGEAVARWLLSGGDAGRTFARDLLSRLEAGDVAKEEVRGLLDVLRPGLEHRSPILGEDRFTGLDGVCLVLGPVLDQATAGGEATEGWVELLLAMLADAEGDSVSTLLDALAAVGTVEHVPRIRALEASVSTSRRERVEGVIRAIQARSSGVRGGISLASTAGGDIGLADRQEERPRPPRGRQRDPA